MELLFIENTMRKILLFLTLAILYGLSSAQNITVSGYLYEKGSMETIPGGIVYEPVSQKSASTNAYGFYSLSLPFRDSLFVVFSTLGYANDTLFIAKAEDVSHNAQLYRINTLQSVNITAARRLSEDTRMSSVTLSAKEVKSIPILFGEKDVFKTLLLMPGVQSGTEGTSGIYVRGGGADQNLVILDEATIYNASHLLGFFSIFNGDAIKSVELIKGGFPARYGGRLSSVIEINMKDGNKESYHCEGGIGIIASHAMAEGPIVKGKSSFMVSARTTYLDLLTRPVMKLTADGMTAGYYFYDFNAKLNYNLSDKDRLFVSAYFGRDKFYVKQKDKQDSSTYKSSSGLFWQNATATARWNHLFGNRIFSNLSFVFNDYTMKFYADEKQTDYTDNSHYEFHSTYNSGIRDYTLKYDVTYISNASHRIQGGILTTYHEARPSAISLAEDTTIFQKAEKELGLEYALYAEDEFTIKGRLRLNPGIRLTFFTVPGRTYISPEPRFSASFNIRKDLAVKASYATMSQSMILLSTSTIGLPTDLWVPVTDRIRPQRSHQVALGLHYDLRNPRLSFSLEGYYKKSNHILAYKEGASFFTSLIDDLINEGMGNTGFQSRWSDNVTSGQGWSYGVEFLVRKEVGKFTGWIGYTLSWTRQQFDDLNFGKPFWARHDRRHDVSVVLMYSPTAKINLSLSWTFATGNAVTLPTVAYGNYGMSEYLFETLCLHKPISSSYYVESYGEKNNFRMKPFHHLDLGIQILKPHGERFQSIFEVSIYNVYNYKNPFYYYVDIEYDLDNNTSKRVLKSVCIFPIIPSFTYHFKF